MKKFDGNSLNSTVFLTSKRDNDAAGPDARMPENCGTDTHSATTEALPAAAGASERKILMSSLNGIYIYDFATGVNTYINPQYTRLTGYALENLQDLNRETSFALVHPEDRKRVAAHLERIGRAADNETLEIEYRFRTAGGRWMCCLAKEAVFDRDTHGRVRRVIGTFLDITARKTAAENLARERELLQKLIETIPVMITIYDPALRHFSVNRAFRRILGWSEKDLDGGGPMEKFYADPAEREAARRFMESLQTGWRTFKVTAKDGETVESAWANIRLSDDTRIGVGIDMRERTAQLEAIVAALEKENKARQDLENKLRQWARVFMDAADPIIIEDLAGTIIDMNREAERVYGWKRSELIGKSIRSLLPPARYQWAERLRERCRRGEEVRNWEGQRQDMQGRVFSTLVTAFPLLDETGSAVALATIAKDITALKQIERELEQSREYLRELSRKSIEALENDRRTTGKELHDSIGGSLAAIKLKLETIAEDMSQQPEIAAVSLANTIASLQTVIKESKQIAANLRPTILDDLGILSTITWYMRQFSEQFGSIRLIPEIKVCEKNIPGTHKIVIYRVLEESLHNAAKHSEATEVHLSLKCDADWIVLDIADNGRGFDVEKTLSREDPLSGFGMVGMIERAEIVGGSLRIDSASGKGTHIRMNLPRKPYAG